MTTQVSDAPVSSPFPWFGAKRKVAAEIWARLGNPLNYVEPFAGSAAVLLARPDAHRWWERFETICDADGHLSNWFRAVTADPEAVARHASWPVNEVDLTARHLWLVQQRSSLTAALMSDPDYYDARAAGWWVWGVCAWVGGDWCTGIGPYTGSSAASLSQGGVAPGVYRKMPMIAGGHGGKGIHRPRPVNGETSPGTPLPDVSASALASLTTEFAALASRLRRVRVTCGNWDRVLGSAAVAPKGHVTGVVLDPPYDPSLRRGDLYAVGDRPEDRASEVHVQAREWALGHGSHPQYRIAYCSYSTPREDNLFAAAGWVSHHWSALGGYGLRAENRARENRDREVVWFSPHCLRPDDQPLSLFDDLYGPSALAGGDKRRSAMVPAQSRARHTADLTAADLPLTTLLTPDSIALDLADDPAADSA